jgi:hypothetical protein
MVVQRLGPNAQILAGPPKVAILLLNGRNPFILSTILGGKSWAKGLNRTAYYDILLDIESD